MKTIKKKLQEKTNIIKPAKKFKLLSISILVVTLSFVYSGKVSAHCDGLDGPVIKAAQKALETNDVKLVMVWVQKTDEDYIRDAFERTMKLRSINTDARDLADTYFFETLVRIHRAGEGASYTGLKPAGRDLGPAIPAGDKAIISGSAKELWTLLSNSIHNKLHEKYTKVEQLKNYDSKDVEKGREFVKAYVEYIHFVEKIYEMANAVSEHQSDESAHAH